MQNLQTVTNISIIPHRTLNILRSQSSTAKYHVQVKQKGNMKFWFLQRNYPAEVVDKETNKVKFKFNSTCNKVRNEETKYFSLIVMFHLSLKKN